MEEVGTCPNCQRSIRKIKLGAEPARIVCNRFGCDWDGIKAEHKA